MTSHLDGTVVREFDSLDPAHRGEAIAHVDGCAACRAELLAADPSHIFALLSLDPVPRDALESLSRRVGADIDALPAERGGGDSRRRWHAFGAIAASLLLAGVFTGYLLTRGVPVSSAVRLPVRSVAEVEAGQDNDAPVRGIELISSPGEAQVLELSVGETQVVMIFDEALDI